MKEDNSKLHDISNEQIIVLEEAKIPSSKDMIALIELLAKMSQGRFVLDIRKENIFCGVYYRIKEIFFEEDGTRHEIEECFCSSDVEYSLVNPFDVGIGHLAKELKESLKKVES